MNAFHYPDRNARIPTALGLASVLMVSACGGGGNGETQGMQTPKVACESLTGTTFNNVDVVAALQVAASGAVPSYCKVSGTEAGTQHDMEVRMPDTWARRLVQEGGGGFDGSIPGIGTNGSSSPQLSVNVPLSSGAVQAVTNGGHRDPSGEVLLNNPPVVERYAHKAIITTNRFSKAVAAAYYGEGPRFTYFEGCSNGGRGALNAAAKYGTEFDGVIAGAPTRNLTGQIEQWARASASTLPSPAKLSGIAAAAVAKCDALDGVSDGVVSKWSACTFDPATDVPPSVGVTSPEAAAVKALMTDVQLSNGTTIYSGFGVGDMASWGPRYASLGIGHIRNIVLNDATWPATAFDVNTLYPIINQVIENTYQFNASATGLSQFMNAGRKVMIWHGSDDALLSHKDTIRTWKQVTDLAGDSVAQANSRLYIASGVNHCGGGPGANRFDLLTPMIAWVEQGKAPETPTAQRVDAATGTTLFTRPLCINPQYPKYKGAGDVNSADSYLCSME